MMSSFKIQPRRFWVCAALVLCCLFAASCSGGAQRVDPDLSDTHARAFAKAQAAEIAMPASDGEPLLEAGEIAVRADHASDGYFTVECGALGGARHKLQVQKGEKIYYYDLRENTDMLVFPLQMGDGTYAIALYRQVEGDRYALLAQAELTVALASEFSPFLVPNEYVAYNRDSEAVSAALIIARGAASDVEKADLLYRYIIGNITYDRSKAELAQAGDLTGYLPDPDLVLDDKAGICFDYAALYASMLRANGVPAKLVTGYAEPGHVYHAWNMVYLVGSGWVGVDVRADGKAWVLADTTFAASDSTAGVTYFPVNEY